MPHSRNENFEGSHNTGSKSEAGRVSGCVCVTGCSCVRHGRVLDEVGPRAPGYGYRPHPSVRLKHARAGSTDQWISGSGTRKSGIAALGLVLAIGSILNATLTDKYPKTPFLFLCR
jgi:hypothetical protein